MSGLVSMKGDRTGMAGYEVELTSLDVAHEITKTPSCRSQIFDTAGHEVLRERLFIAGSKWHSRPQ
jgi:hypothetical protein